MKLSEKRSHIMRRYRLRYTHCQIKSGLHREVVDKLTRKRQTTPKQQQMSEISLLGIFHGWGSQTAHPWKERCSNSINADFSYSNILTPYFCHKKIPQTEWRQRQKALASHVWRLEGQDLGIGSLGFSWGLSLGLLQTAAFSLCSRAVALLSVCICVLISYKD